MSIAVSAVIHPSPALRMAGASLCAAVLAGGAWCGASPAGIAMMIAGAAGAVCQRRLVKLVRIDISAVGQIRLAVYHQRDAQNAGVGQSVRLLPGSTLWPGLLLLRLRVEPEEVGKVGKAGKARRVYWLTMLPDSAAPDVRRRLAVAIRAIAAGRADGAGSIGGAKKNPANP
jgi:toxin CptA